MAKQTINIGASPNDGTGTPLRTAFDYTNQNFTELYTAVGPSGNNIVVPGNATITGDLTVDTSTLKVDSANNRVGVATASPRVSLDVASGDIYSSGQITWGGSSPTVNQGFLSFTGGNAVVGSAGATALLLYTNGAERCNITSAGNLSITSGNVVMATSGKGIDFSATSEGSGTMTSELLNDYEEGTFTPTVLGATTAGTATYGGRAGYYTKIGRLVTVNIYMDWNSATGTGQMRFGGLPFTSSSSSLSFSSATFGLVNGIALTANHILTGYTETNNTVISANSYPAGGGTYTAVPIDAAGELVITCTYMAA